MKKKFMSTKIKITIISLLIAIIGCYSTSAIILYNSDYKLSNYWDFDFEFNFDFSNGIFGFKNFNKSSGTLTLPYEDSLKDIKVETSSADTEIIFDDTQEIKVDISGNFRKSYDYKNALYEFKIDENTLKITANDKSSIVKNLELKVHIPSKYKDNLIMYSSSGDIKLNNSSLNNINLQTSSGDIKANNKITCNEISINASSGEIEFSDLTSSVTNFTASSGDIDLKGTLGKLSLETSSGEIELYCLNDLENNSKLTSSSGDIKMNLRNINSYTINYSTSSGNLKCDYDYNKKDKHSYTIGNGASLIDITTSSGDLEINN